MASSFLPGDKQGCNHSVAFFWNRSTEGEVGWSPGSAGRAVGRTREGRVQAYSRAISHPGEEKREKRVRNEGVDGEKWEVLCTVGEVMS